MNLAVSKSSIEKFESGNSRALENEYREAEDFNMSIRPKTLTNVRFHWGPEFLRKKEKTDVKIQLYMLLIFYGSLNFLVMRC